MFKRIPTVARGDTIRADWANDIVKQVNRNSRQLYTQSQFSAMDANNGHNVYKDTGGGGGVDYGTTWTFNKTVENTVSQTYTDSNSDTVTIPTVTAFTCTGNLNGNNITLVLNLPT